MKKLTVKLEVEFEVPDHWEICSPDDNTPLHVKIDGDFYYPDITWMLLDNPDAPHKAWREADGDFQMNMLDIVKENFYSLELAKDKT